MSRRLTKILGNICAEQDAVALPISEQGSVLVELAISILLLLTFLLGMMEACLAVYADHFLANAAREATRYAAVRGSSWNTTCANATAINCSATSGSVSSYVLSLTPAGINTTKLVIATSWPGIDATGAGCSTGPTNVPGCVVSVRVSYPFTFSLPYVNASVYTLSSTSKVTIAQ